MMKNLKLSCFIAVVTIVFTSQVNASIYKCINTSGKVVYKDKPCSVLDTQKKLNAVKTPKSLYIPDELVNTDKVEESKSVIIGETANESSQSRQRNDEITSSSVNLSTSSDSSHPKSDESSRDSISKNKNDSSSSANNKQEFETMH